MQPTNEPEPELDSPEAIWGSELRYYREQAELSQDALAAKVGWSRSLIQHLETGKRRPQADTAKACDDALAARGALIRLRGKLFKRLKLWPGFRALADAEKAAKVIRGYESMMIPGLLQTPGYARLVLRGDEDAVAARLDRQQLLSKENPPTARFVLDESVLYRSIGDNPVLVEQLEHLEQVAASGQVHVQISPTGSVVPVHASFVLVTLDGETVGYQEATTEGLLMTKREDVLVLEGLYDELIAEALPTKASLEAIRKAMERWKT